LEAEVGIEPAYTALQAARYRSTGQTVTRPCSDLATSECVAAARPRLPQKSWQPPPPLPQVSGLSIES